ncbi:MAG: hypothetical protein EOO56_14800 [Hymenobacter sp.]|nr:MAG: hypothetical protein EOO56_14800 [Hymenobacter sp.]
MKASLKSGLPWAGSVAWHTSTTAAPIWGAVSVSQPLPQALPAPRPGCHVQVLLGAAALSLAAQGDGR